MLRLCAVCSEIVLSVRRLFGSTAHFWALASGAGGAIRITLCLLSCPHALAQLLGGMQRMPDPSLAYLSVVLCPRGAGPSYMAS